MRCTAPPIIVVVGLLALLLAACSGGADQASKPSPTVAQSSPTVAQLSPTPTATAKVSATATPTPSKPRIVDMDAVAAAVLGIAPGYVEQPPAPANLAARDGLLAFVGDVTSFGGEIEHWTLSFVDGGEINAWILILKGDEGLAAVRDWLQAVRGGAGTEFSEGVVADFEAAGLAIAGHEDLASASTLGEGGFGVTVQTGAGSYVLALFGRSNMIVAVDAFIDPELDAVAIAGAIDDEILRTVTP